MRAHRGSDQACACMRRPVPELKPLPEGFQFSCGRALDGGGEGSPIKPAHRSTSDRLRLQDADKPF